MAKLGIKHKRGGAYNHQSQGLVECGIKSLKQLYCKLDPIIRSPVKLQYAVMSLNNMVKADGSGSAAQMFFGRTPRSDKFGLVAPVRVNREELAKARSNAHKVMREKSKGNRRLDKFLKNDRILLQDDKSGKFSHRATEDTSRDCLRARRPQTLLQWSKWRSQTNLQCTLLGGQPVMWRVQQPRPVRSEHNPGPGQIMHKPREKPPCTLSTCVRTGAVAQ